jgi:hypothetical protein
MAPNRGDIPSLYSRHCNNNCAAGSAHGWMALWTEQNDLDVGFTAGLTRHALSRFWRVGLWAREMILVRGSSPVKHEEYAKRICYAFSSALGFK